MITVRVALILCAAGLSACLDAGPTAAPLTPTDRAVIDEWLGCVECSDGELDSVASLAARLPAAVIDTLRADLFRGPSAARRDNVRQQLQAAYQELDALIAPAAPPVTEQQYVERYLENLISLYRIRAGTALARIQGAAAVPRLDSAIQGYVETPGDVLRPDVIDALAAVKDSAASL